jgi:hypothetical protein
MEKRIKAVLCEPMIKLEDDIKKTIAYFKAFMNVRGGGGGIMLPRPQKRERHYV